MVQFTDSLFAVIEKYFGPRLGRWVATVLLGLIVAAIAVFCFSLIWTSAVAPVIQFALRLNVLSPQQWEAMILGGLTTAVLTWLVFRILMNAWMQGTHQLIERLEQSQADARAIIGDVRADARTIIGDVRTTADQVHNNILKLIDDSKKEINSWSSDIQGDIRNFYDTVKPILNSLAEVEERLANVERKLPPDQ